MMTHWTDHHRGPFQLCVTRPGKKAGSISTEWLRGTVDSDTIDEEAHALLTDPRDTVRAVTVWSQRDQQFVWSYVK